MSGAWPGDWHSKTPESREVQTGETATLFNDHGIVYMQGDEAEEYMWIENIPNHLENHC